MDVKLEDRDFWYNLHGQVPGLLDWDMGNECFLTCTTDHCSFAEQCLAKYKIQLIDPPTLPLVRNPNPGYDGPPTEPNLWMWVNPNIVSPAISKEPPSPNHEVLPNIPFPQTEEYDYTETQRVVESLSFFHDEYCPYQTMPFFFTYDPVIIEEEAKEQEWTFFNKYNNKQTLCQNPYQEKSWPHPPLNYSHLVALALKSNPACGLNVQQIYNFTCQHFPYFHTAPESWKTSICCSLCSLTCFEKVPVPLENELDGKPWTFFWKLTDEGHRFFCEDTRVLVYARKERIKQSMRQPELIDALFHL